MTGCCVGKSGEHLLNYTYPAMDVGAQPYHFYIEYVSDYSLQKTKYGQEPCIKIFRGSSVLDLT